VKSYFANLICLPFGNFLCDAVSLISSGKPIAYSWVDGACWSLLVEIRFYFLLWLLFYMLKIKRVEIPVAVMGMLAAINMPLGLISKGQDFLIYLPFFSFGMAYRASRNGDPFAVWVLVFSALVSIYNAAENVSGISMNLGLDNLFGYVVCHLIFVVLMVIFKNGASRARIVINYLGVLSYPLYLIHQDIGLIGIEFLKDSVSPSLAVLFVIVFALTAASAAQSIAARLTMAMKHGLAIWGNR
jgi:peptidoglycan/LPS O-acetylase OafA/YrhL